ncbi:hypothetical protein BCR34DRAFT_278950 [Clohesyomyces aquaticus]|uniref:Uncharacterized protein n=1 Tax=Clohesyomyces aquaticus TaxID=1231657 RepID=A0A1Y1ZS28_9PLEO|nr:hypothetical protein BCR34DRAFT_278950 [Clohesyomyces aquaticus]
MGSPGPSSFDRRYALRQRTSTQTARINEKRLAPRSPAATRKRGWAAENNQQATTPKRTRMSQSMAVLNAGDPSPIG